MKPLLTALLALSLSFTAWAENPRVELSTVHGSIIIELDAQAAPVSVENFLYYVNAGYYSDTIFHRVIPGFMVQGGGFGINGKTKQGTVSAIVNEASNGLPNLRGTIAMARTSDPDSATAQFFINHQDNPFLDKTSSSAGYAVFGKVIEGMDIVDRITEVPTKTKGMYRDWPAEPVIVYKAYHLVK
jgi:peptidyl-prolyl cis-trans isomerase A (cyclophilin A)|tara:strand:+ start:2455 stop:3012 length:558 start_codon:yes stop_codon:yes gene_type:complete